MGKFCNSQGYNGEMLTGKAYLRSLLRKRMSAAVLFLNVRDEILSVKPRYKDYRSLPGGVVEKDELPMAAAVREMKEDISLIIAKLKFVAVDYADRDKNQGKRLLWYFYGGILNESQQRKISVDGKEITEWRFFDLNGAIKAISRRMSKRWKNCPEAVHKKEVYYVENQERK